MNRRKALAVLGLALVMGGAPLLAAAQQSLSAQKAIIAARFPAVRWVTTGTLARWMGRGGHAGPVILDARAPEEFRVSHLRGARRVDPDLEDVSSLGIDPGARIVVYCSVGWRSGAIASRLEQAGYRQVYNLEGGIFRWANEGRAMYRGDHVVHRVHPYDQAWGRMLDDQHRASLH